jgi:hypothetical protein
MFFRYLFFEKNSKRARKFVKAVLSLHGFTNQCQKFSLKKKKIQELFRFSRDVQTAQLLLEKKKKKLKKNLKSKAYSFWLVKPESQGFNSHIHLVLYCRIQRSVCRA